MRQVTFSIPTFAFCWSSLVLCSDESFDHLAFCSDHFLPICQFVELPYVIYVIHAIIPGQDKFLIVFTGRNAATLLALWYSAKLFIKYLLFITVELFPIVAELWQQTSFQSALVQIQIMVPSLIYRHPMHFNLIIDHTIILSEYLTPSSKKSSRKCTTGSPSANDLLST